MATAHTSQRRNLSSRHKQVDELVRMYDGVKEPSTSLREVLCQPERASLLVFALGRQILLIKSRSLAFDDGQVTLYDRALLVLSLDGNDLANIGALELFATEYLGGLTFDQDIVFKSKELDVQYALEKTARFHKTEASHDMAASTGNQEETFLASLFHNHQQDRVKSLSSAPSQGGKQGTGTKQSHSPGQKSKATTTNNEIIVRLNRMLAIYYRAKEDYNRVCHCDNGYAFDAVRFLRDTTENTIIYLRTQGLSNHASMAELEETFQHSKAKVAEFYGGRKRHFDDEYPENAVNALPVGGKRHGSKRQKPRRAMIDSYRPM